MLVIDCGVEDIIEFLRDRTIINRDSKIMFLEKIVELQQFEMRKHNIEDTETIKTIKGFIKKIKD